MARITHVKAAEQRYRTVPVIDPATGLQKETPVMRNGQQRKTKRGTPIVRRVTVADKAQPLPNRKCEKCGVEIVPGMPYKHVSPKSGPYGGHKRVRCAPCPTWAPSELSSSKMSGVYAAQEQLGSELEGCETVEDLETLRDDIADQVEAVGDEYCESADNIEDGFGHPVSMSEELREKGEELKSWADEIRSTDFDEYEGDEADTTCQECNGSGQVEADCTTCEGTGMVEAEEGDEDANEEGEIECGDCDGGQVEEECSECDGTGEVEAEEDEDARQAWLDEQREKLQSIVDECPV